MVGDILSSCFTSISHQNFVYVCLGVDIGRGARTGLLKGMWCVFSYPSEHAVIRVLLAVNFYPEAKQSCKCCGG